MHKIVIPKHVLVLFMLSEGMLNSNESHISVEYIWSVVQKLIPSVLCNQYKIDLHAYLSNLLLSSRVHEKMNTKYHTEAITTMPKAVKRQTSKNCV